MKKFIKHFIFCSSFFFALQRIATTTIIIRVFEIYAFVISMILRQVYIIESHTAFSERNVTLYNGSRKPN